MMPPNKTTQSSNETKDTLIRVVRSPNSQASENVKVLSPDELDRADNAAMQKANALIAQAELKELPNRNNLSDTPYVHNATYGFGELIGAEWLMFKNNRSRKILLVSLILITAVITIIKYA
jgi:hypothetical protein